jgi:hypothetical protein|tara:strand:- start:58 stop:303 length:246 start_codon:yes stop_codon:yes gene_type:complete
MKGPQQQGLNIDFKNTTAIEGFDGGHLFGQAFVLRKVSKFVVGGSEDAMLPIPVFYDLETKKIIKDSLPKELRDEYKDITL